MDQMLLEWGHLPARFGGWDIAQIDFGAIEGLDVTDGCTWAEKIKIFFLGLARRLDPGGRSRQTRCKGGPTLGARV